MWGGSGVDNRFSPLWIFTGFIDLVINQENGGNGENVDLGNLYWAKPFW